jgi:hypothetical protein
MSTFTKRILFAAATTGMVFAGVGAIGNLSLGTAAFTKETEHADHERGGKSGTGAYKASHDRSWTHGRPALPVARNLPFWILIAVHPEPSHVQGRDALGS